VADGDLRTRRQQVERRNEEIVMDKRSLVSVVDDDESVRESLPDLLKELGFAVQSFASGEEFLTSRYLEQTKCLILDIAMPGMSGFDVQRELKTRNHSIPIVFITAQRDENARSSPVKESAVACLLKPFSDTSLLQAIRTVLGAE
jgi:FixJ family two-component response regulator